MGRNFSSETERDKRFFITTPIFYVNAQPHLGHVYSAVLADASARFQQLQGVPQNQTLFSTGTDEHGQKIQQAAAANKSDVLGLCDNVSERFRSLFDSTNVGYSHYIRTTEERHKKTVQSVFKTLVDRGHIYRGDYSGWYCVSDEAFLTDSQLREVTLPSGEKKLVSAESGHPVEWNNEENYMFRLSEFREDLLVWLKDDKRVQPKRFHQQLLTWLEDELPDLSVSRPRSRISWGVPVPGDEQHTVYVWVDALINYLTVAGYPDLTVWPPDVQVLGKDILRFHGLYWPALLMGAGLEPPHSLLCHSHWTVEGEKMSKSLGNVVCPWESIQRYTSDGLRYLLLRGGTPHSDSNWSEKQAILTLNVELADTLGNLLNRCTAPSLNPSQLFPPMSPEYLQQLPDAGLRLVELLNDLPDVVAKHYTEFNFYHGLEEIMATVRQANVFIQDEKPWELKNQPDRTKLDSVLRLALEAVRVAGVMLQPVVPSLASQLLDTLGIQQQQHYRSWQALSSVFDNPRESGLLDSHPLGPRRTLFAKIKV
ncbi:hypothetical protein Pcinc_042642 [Petrolisthes cinctipes]|uniref:Methionine--tRNA ligase, mitochondrial n=1 Tax=Petrolisthes cinctipes TaxID=88211 RepID=A0AAE1EH16_PETCI|nr:hypothetical protein Pcinc_042642 [Petrolisthes cinctipes]